MRMSGQIVGFDLRCFALVLTGLVGRTPVCTWTPMCSLSCLFDIVLTVSTWMLMYHIHVCCVICALHKPKGGYCFLCIVGAPYVAWWCRVLSVLYTTFCMCYSLFYKFLMCCCLLVFALTAENCVCGLKSNFYICVLEQIGNFVHCWAVEVKFGPNFGLGCSYWLVHGLVGFCVYLVF
jgi:hypothetical protein